MPKDGIKSIPKNVRNAKNAAMNTPRTHERKFKIGRDRPLSALASPLAFIFAPARPAVCTFFVDALFCPSEDNVVPVFWKRRLPTIWPPVFFWEDVGVDVAVSDWGSGVSCL